MQILRREVTIGVMKINIFQAEETTNHEGTAHLVRLLQNLPNQQIIQTMNFAWIEVGQHLEEHMHADCVEYYLFMSGIGEMRIGEEKIEVKKGDFLVVEMGKLHTLENKGDEKLEFVTIRALLR